MQPEHLLKIISKVALLEAVLIELVAERALSEPAPESAFTTFSEHLRAQIDAKAKAFPNKPEAQAAALIGLNEFDDFSDRVRALIRAAAQRRQP